ncbi:cytochrome P450 [Amycolatopsis sp. cg5]|uniref:cytochrome P450 n=1 Tax=Amycolatopsis sp. cg5 TaxID=3238802 RepID=UPI003524EA9D
MNRPPGPRGSRLTGNLAAYEQDRLGFVLEQTNAYGPVWSFDSHTVVAAGADEAGEVLTRPEFVVASDHLHRELSASKALRSHTRSARMRGLRPSAVTGWTARITETIEGSLARWPAEIDVVAELRRLTSGLGAALCFGEDAATMVEREQELFAALTPIAGSAFRMPRWVPGSAHAKTARANRELESRIQTLIDRRRADRAAGSDDILTLLMTPTGRHGDLDDQPLRSALVSTWLAAQSSPTAGMAWVLLDLARHPEAREAAARDLESTRAVVQESMRIHPPTWLLERTVGQDTELGGYHLPAGTMVKCSPYLVHRDQRYFTDPERFRLDRWGPDGEGTRAPRFAYLPFGVGARVCMGMAWSMALMTNLTHLIARRFHLRELPGASYFADPGRELIPRGLRLGVG